MKSNEEIINENLTVIESMVEKGSTDKEIAEKIGIGYSTFRKYKATNTDLKAIIAQGKDKKNQSVEQAVYNCSVGYYYHEEIVTKIKTGEFEEDVKISSVRKYKCPDLAAQKYWLNNKNKVSWKDDPNKVDNDKKLTKLKEKEINAKVDM